MIKYMWSADVTVPASEKKRWVTNERYFIVAKDVEDALAMIKTVHPDVTVIKIQRDRNVDDVLIREEDTGVKEVGLKREPETLAQRAIRNLEEDR